MREANRSLSFVGVTVKPIMALQTHQERLNFKLSRLKLKAAVLQKNRMIYIVPGKSKSVQIIILEYST